MTMSILHDEIEHLTGVLAGLSSDNPGWTKAQNRIVELREKIRTNALAAEIEPATPLVPVEVKEQIESDLTALENLAGGGDA